MSHLANAFSRRGVFESMRDAPPRLKMIWDVSAPECLEWRNEMSIDGTTWQLIEEYQMLPVDTARPTE